MTGNIPYIGSKISLITTSDIRYEGILYTLKSEESTIAVQNVRSFGTEGRRTPEVPMSNEIYDFIIFRGKDLKDLTVLQEAPERLAGSPFQVGSDYGDSYGGAFQNHSMFPDAGGFPGVAPMGAFQRPGIGNTAARPFSPVAGGLPFSSYQPVPYPDTGFGRSAEKGFGLHCRPSYPCVEQQEPPPQSPAPGSRSLFDENSGVASSRATSEEAMGNSSRTLDAKDRNGEARDQKARGRGKGATQKKPFFEVIRNHEKAKDVILKAMRSQNSALGSAELRALSEVNPAVYHFYLDFENHCCPHVVQSDEQQWEMLCKALKKHFEKEIGLGQSQKAPQRPNSTLGDFITIQESGKKSSKAGRGRGRGAGRSDKLEPGGPVGSGQVEEPVQSGASWNCPRCTLSNDTILVECAACGTSKQQAALWAEFPPLG
jgi:hypothetical protein